ncbi:MAG: sigma-70 family RNA polymerase sigma factor [Butyrivibrio sp.]|nr:sigma-70 family RNA polymerase sigma factor [Butyrivibrio sp.]
MDDSKIVDLFLERSEKAIVELSNKYGSMCMKLAMNLLNDRQDAEECVNDAYFGVWNSIPPQKPKILVSFVNRVVRNISINRYKKNNADKRKGNYDLCIEELEGCIASQNSVEDEIAESELSSYIDEFLDSLNKVNRMLFVRRYWYMDDYGDISEMSGLKEGTVRVRLSRIKANLKVFLERRGVFV